MLGLLLVLLGSPPPIIYIVNFRNALPVWWERGQLDVRWSRVARNLYRGTSAVPMYMTAGGYDLRGWGPRRAVRMPHEKNLKSLANGT